MSNNSIVQGFDDESIEGLKVKLDKLEGVPNGLMLTLRGYVDTYNSNVFLRTVQKAIAEGYFKLIFHCTGLSYVSSTGIGTFTAFLKAVKAKGGDFVLLDLQPKIHEVFQLLGFSTFFTMRDSLDESINHLKLAQTTGTTTSVFPKVITCPICNKKLNVAKSGRFRCSACKSILAINDMAQVFLG